MRTPLVLLLGLLAWSSSTACGRTGLVDVPAPGEADAGLPGCVPLAQAAADEALRARWNVAVDAVQPLTRDFHWTRPDDFPHPTYRLGDKTAYAEFSTVLVRFWETAGNIDFVRCNQLFDRAYAVGPGVATTKTVQLRAVTAEMSTSSLVPEARQQALLAICETIGC